MSDLGNANEDKRRNDVSLGDSRAEQVPTSDETQNEPNTVDDSVEERVRKSDETPNESHINENVAIASLSPLVRFDRAVARMFDRLAETGIYKLLRTLEAIGFILAVVLFVNEMSNRTIDRDVRIATLISTSLQIIDDARDAESNRGQVYALEILHRLSEDGSFSLSGLDLSHQYLSGVRLDGADLMGASLEDSDLSGASLRGATLCANLIRTNFDKADLSHAKVVDAAVSETRFYKANVTGADFQNTTLTYNQITQMCYVPTAGEPPHFWQVKNGDKWVETDGLVPKALE